MDMMISNLQQQRQVTEQLRREAGVKRISVSQAVQDMIKFISEHQRDDCLIVGFSSQKANPFREKTLPCRSKLPSWRHSRGKLIIREIETASNLSSVNKKAVYQTFGQPTHLTHPHRVSKGEIVPGIQQEELKLRRSRLVESMRLFCSKNELNDKTLIVVIPSSYKKYMTEKIPYVYRQNSDFLYLTGCMEPDSILVLISKNDSFESVLCLRGRDPASELWDGPRTGIDQAVELFGVDKSIATNSFEDFAQHLMKQNRDSMIWYDFANEIHPDIHKTMQKFASQTKNKIWESPRPFVHQLRLYKSKAEQKLMKKSCEIASDAIKKAMRSSRPSISEAALQAQVDFECRINGAEYLAYPPVVASGPRANIIHYINNDNIVNDGDLILMDAGCEYHAYCSDITRTWPISGKFSPAQRTLYEVVYSVQTDLIKLCSKFPTLNQLYEVMGRLLAERLKESGVISQKVPPEEIRKCVSQFCPHHVSHYLGMDVHDTSTVPRHIPLEPGMVLTVEPGVYVNYDNRYANPEYHGIGIRIEDDVLITHEGPVVLTEPCPKHPDEIERLCCT
ncbi:hypothetical protein RUM44_012642 [Polyplax serrata]|uniref:G protein gamma domain-containing protein n=1 Tax=Polyplax serrata TaxID=468196 RepID=A0ABR1BFY3_POLSC